MGRSALCLTVSFAAMSGKPFLGAGALKEHIDLYLDPALSSRRTAAGPARDLPAFCRRQQDFVLHWGAVIARDKAELAY